jgi:hypothetical protein
MPTITPRFKFEHFPRGSAYSAKSEFQRFVTVDFNMESYVGVIGVGVISGWEIEQTTDREIRILPGRGIIDGYFAESPYTVKQRSEMVSGDREVETIKRQEAPEEDLTTAEEATYISVIQEYDPTFNPDSPVENAFVKVVVPYTVTLPDDEDSYIWVTRKFTNFYPAMDDYPPYLIPEPSSNDYATFDEYLTVKEAYDAQMDTIYAYDWQEDPANHFTEVEFNNATSFSASPTKVLIGKVTTRSNEVVNIDTSQVNSLQKLEATITNYANKVISAHHHGGAENFDPPKINLETDVRQAILTSYNPESRRGIFSVVESQLSGTEDGHRHTFTVDADGNGQTVGIVGVADNHYHKIVGGVIQTQEFTTGTVSDHTHTLPDVSKLVWDANSEYIVYVNGIAVGDDTSSNITADPAGKTVTLTGIIGGITKTYGVNFDYEGTNFQFSQQQSNVYRFMLNTIREFNAQFPSADISTNPFVFFDETENSIAGIGDLKAQSITGEALLRDADDTFVFTPDAARNIEVTLLDYQKTEGLESDNVTIEILGNSEVSGIIRPENIFFINAQKITTGIFEISQLPFLSHVGRIDEGFSSFQYPLISKDGVEFLVTPAVTDTTLDHYHSLIVTDETTGFTENTLTGDEPIYYAIGQTGSTYLVAHIHSVTSGTVEEAESTGLLDWQNDINDPDISSSAHTHEVIFPIAGDAKVVYSMFEDRHGNLYAGTSDDFIMISDEDSFVFVINDLQFYETGTDLLTMFESAKQNYEIQTGIPLKITSDIYTVQIALAEDALVNVGDSYLIVGKSEPESVADQTMIQKVGFVPVPNYKSSGLKDFNEVGSNEIIVEIQLRDVTSGELLDPDNEDVQAQIAEDPDSVKLVARTEKHLNETPAISIQVQEITENGITYDDILTVGGDIAATNRNVQDNFYFDWSSPNTPSSVGIFKNAAQDEEGSVWVASNNGVLVLRNHNQSTIFSRTTRPGTTPDIKDILVFDSNNVFCASDGIYKTEDQGKTWTEKLAGNFNQIIQDISAIKVLANFGHTHALNVNINGNGTLELADGHTHTVTNWTVEEASGHTHDLDLVMYAVSSTNVYKSTNSGEDWAFVDNLPTGENGDAFAHFGNLFLSKPDGIYRHGGGWNRVNQIVAYSFQPSYDLDSVFVGSLNTIHNTTDGSSYTDVFVFSGFPLNVLQIDGANKNFGYSYSNRGQTFFLTDITVTDQDVASLVNFDKWFAENGMWSNDAPYDIFINDKLILSTKTDVDNREERGWSFSVDPSIGLIDFSGTTALTNDLEVFDNFIEVDDSSSFQAGDKILIKKAKTGTSSTETTTTEDITASAKQASAIAVQNHKDENTYLYATVSAVAEGIMSFSPRSIIAIDSGTQVVKIPNLDANSSIRLNIYDSFLSNIGVNTHQELEDKLSYVSDQRPYELNNAYLSDLLQLTQAAKYALPNIDSKMLQTLFYDFHYSEDPEDDNYVGNFIDLTNSEAYSLVNYQSPFEEKGALSINKILIGSGAFSGNIIVGTDIGVFWAVLTDSVNANWFYVWDLPIPVYDMRVFGEVNLLVATGSGVYLTTDMLTWTLQDQEAVRFPALSMSLRWPEESFVVIPSHTATFKNTTGDPQTGLIKSSQSYADLEPNRSIRVEILSDTSNSKHETSYLITQISGNDIFVSPTFPDVPETLTEVRITMGSWWQQFDGEDNLGNIALTNTLLVGGQNKIAYTPFLGDFVWTSALFSSGIENVNIVNFLPISTGGILASAVGTDLDNVVHQVIRSSDLGKAWSTFKKFEEIRGTIQSSKLTSFGHSELVVTYTFPSDLKYADGEFDKRKISLFLEGQSEPIFNGRVIFNNGFGSTIILLGQGAHEAILQNPNANLSFEIYPIAVSDMVETSDKRILFGTEVGIYEDSQTTIGEFPYEGNVWSVGEPGRITNIDISGKIKSISINPADNSVIASVSSGSNISADQFKGQTFYVVDLPTVTGFTIKNNSSRTIGGEITVELETEFTPVWLTYVGKNIKFVSENSVLNVEFNFVVQNNQFANGTITLSSNENNNKGTIYNVVSNTSTQIIIDQSVTPYNALSPDGTNLDVIAGQSLIALDSSGRVPISVTFTQTVVDNFLADFSFQVTNGDSPASSISEMTVYENSRNQIILEDFSGLISTEEGASPVALTIQENDSFRATGPIYQPLSSFNNKSTSTDTAHYHDLDLVGGFVDGSIASFTSVLSATVEFEVSDTTLFDSAIVQKDGTLFAEARIRFYNPQQIGVEYFSEVISFTATTITVKLVSGTNWNFDEYNQTRISETWKWEIDATNYGYTSGTFYDDFITSATVITEDIETGDVTVKVADTTNMVAGDKILIISSADKSEVNFVKTITDLTTIDIEVPSSNSYFVANTVQVKVLRDEFSNTHEHMVRNNQVETISVEDYLDRGYPSQHTHRNIALIDVISDMEKEGDNIIVAGSSSFIYNSESDGRSWSQTVDLNDFVEGNLEIQGIVNLESVSDQIVAGTTSGEIFSTGAVGGIILPLDQPEIN